jgi:RNA polymerase sigma factor (sigma-70 family)
MKPENGRREASSERSQLQSSLTLLERAQAGDKAALESLIARYLPRLQRWASGRLPRWARDVADTQDLVQETLFQTFKRIERFESRGEGALLAYLRQGILNRIREELRRTKRRPPRSELDSEAEDNVRSPLEEAIGLDREVALKALRRQESAHSREATAVIDEGRMLAQVRHPNVVTVHGADRSAGRVGLWMEFIQGQTLEHLLRERGPFGAGEATLIGLDVCRALSAVHRAGLLHRDIKARNVMREHGGRIVLMDFGAGVDHGDSDDSASGLAGTPLYMAPEVLNGKEASVGSDIYSVGYFCITWSRGLIQSLPTAFRKFAPSIRTADESSCATLARICLTSSSRLSSARYRLNPMDDTEAPAPSRQHWPP